ncbi:MAG: phosphoribosylformylglycinamidine synthase subunit PurL [Dehalococcoidia bacterium]|nr:phosphoribosylformylglycinamidine synthase subunit PurL [Dehalococcoidia bacterium]
MGKERTGARLAEKLGLNASEYKRIKSVLGRNPNYTELGMFSAMWSEHCSYKNSIKVLKRLPTTGKTVFLAAGENSGGVSIDKDYAVVFKVESHNHPSAVEPYEASATGGGGCIRDIFTVGARPLFLLGSLRFGLLSDKKTKYLFKEVARGFTDYANAVDLPVIAGEVYFDTSYHGNPLVNAMVVGLLKKKNIVRARAAGAGNLVVIAGGRTGRDGVEGASFASSGLDESAKERKSAVAIGDPKIGKKIREACLELAEKGLVVGMQDMGAAGIVCSTSETAYKAGTGIEIDIALVPRKEKGMNPYEIMLSESQERMLLIVAPKKLNGVAAVFRKWKVEFSVIGKVTRDGVLRVKEDGKLVAEVPAEALANGPRYDRESREPKYLEETRSLSLSKVKQPKDYNRVLMTLLSSPTIASKEWVAKKVDPRLTSSLCVKSGNDAGVFYCKQVNRAIAATIDCNGLYCYLDPLVGAEIAIAEAARNLVCCGARPLAVTDGLNFGNPFNPEIYWQFKNVVDGITKACKHFGVPVISGNVSFNNENPKGAVYPTPVIGMVGVIDNVRNATSSDFKKDGDLILLIGRNKEEIGGSQYLSIIHDLRKGASPTLDLRSEKNVQDAVLDLIGQRLVSSAHDCSEGGLSVALAECCVLGGRGAVVALKDRMRTDALLFGESQSRIVVSTARQNQDKVEAVCRKHGAPCTAIGEVKGNALLINDCIKVSVAQMKRVYTQTIPKAVATA